MLLRVTLLLALATSATLASAAPAAYYWWQGKDTTICAQTSPGLGWKRISDGFLRADCSV